MIKKRIDTLWITEGGAPMIDIEKQDSFTYHLREMNTSDANLDSIFTARDSVLASAASRIPLRTQVADALKYGGRGRYHLLQRALNATSKKHYHSSALV